ncbi:B3 domain-containing protein Os07g0563300-like isoform X2 [Syzygium oleosum]|uniref:B3 domain-containing protein Os07g0563300-like isoform X2 n=1 Tax=Syzygium oleosum TaxID=219896 RepID=UPI0011D29A37|nr:B3 domain-containing protein Os07g0563300-like isoform X2 [Syzygium oleosum]
MAAPAPPPAPSSAPAKACFNPECSEAKPERPRKGWRLRAGDFAELCDRCANIYEEGRFCETFHPNASGWRCCESCGKRVHCGCIVSALAFALLDPGGIECMSCARKNLVLTPNPAWPSLVFHAPFPDRLKELSVKNWNQLAGSGPVPWRQAPTLFNTSMSRPELQPRAPHDASTSMDRFGVGERYSISSMDNRRIEDFSNRFMNGNVKLGAVEKLENGIAGPNSDDHLNPCKINPQQSTSVKEDPSTPPYGLAVPHASGNDSNGHIGLAGHFRPAPSTLGKHFYGSMLNDTNSSGESHARNGRPRGDARGRNQLLPRYWPRITDQELQQISGDSNSVITPLFEKMLSASDAGKIGRLVLPKKCAEAYFPPISQPEGLPLKVQDAKGSEWIFQFRFWPNNNSRMYVLEGVTPCIQSMQLQAGDIVTFSRLEPEGKLIMGFRKASTAPPSDQENETAKSSSGITVQDAELADPSSWSKVDKSGYIAKEVLGAKSSLSRKRKSSTLGSKSKRLRIENEDVIELKLTWEEAQGLLRPPPNHRPSVVVIEGFEFEEYEDAPVLGKPTVFRTDAVGKKIQWAQCEDCLKWRKLPADALLPSKWTCADNSWDPERSSCSAAQVLTAEEIEDMLSNNNPAPSKKAKAPKQENMEALEGLDTLANLAILGEGEVLPSSSSPSQATTKHPRHRPGCSCIVCIQPPSGKGPKHKQTCTCNVCLTVKRRFRTLMLRREKKQSEKEAEGSRKKLQHQNLSLAEKLPEDDPSQCNNNTANSSPSQKKAGNDGSDDEMNRIKSSGSPFKGQIDLNIQPEREEDLSPGSDSGGMMKLLHDATQKYLRQRFSTSDSFRNSTGDPAKLDLDGGERPVGERPVGDAVESGHQEVNEERAKALASTVHK